MTKIISSEEAIQLVTEQEAYKDQVREAVNQEIIKQAKDGFNCMYLENVNLVFGIESWLINELQFAGYYVSDRNKVTFKWSAEDILKKNR